ncbi:transposase [Streptomyces murinus]
MFEAFSRMDQRRWGQVYLRGLLLDGRRKSVEPMAARLGEDGNRQGSGELHHHQSLGRGACPRSPRLADAARGRADRADRR